MKPSTKRLSEYKTVILETQGKSDLVSKWSRRGVISQINMDISYIQRRRTSLYAEFPLREDVIAKCDNFLRQLKQILPDD